MAKLYQDHYNCEKLVNSKDKNGQTPIFYVVCSVERGPGKTYSFSKKLFENFLSTGQKFILLTRNKGDLGNVAAGILDSYLAPEYPDYRIFEKIQMKGVFSVIYAEKGFGDEKERHEIGYVIPLRCADMIKKISSLFYDATAFFFDEFQPKGTYLKDEVGLFYDIYKSIARGEGKAVRYMPVYMASNTIQIQNPYFVAFGLTSAIQSNTKFYRGDQVVYERCEIDGLAEMHRQSGIDIALKSYLNKRGDNTWLNDNNSLVAKPGDWGRGLYICTLKYQNQLLGLYEYPSAGLTYISRQIQRNCRYTYNLTLDGDLNIPMIKSAQIFKNLRDKFFKGQVRCSDGGIQQILIDVLV